MLKEILHAAIIDYNSDIPKRFENRKINYQTFLNLISNPDFKVEDSSYHQKGWQKLLKELFPHKSIEAPRKTILIWLLTRNNKYYCRKCQTVKEITEFPNNKTKTSTIGSHCKSCHYISNKDKQPARTSAYKAAKDNRIPPWANLNKIKEFYDNCPEGYHVDHIHPLRGINISGLHVENNLQYLTAKDNISKSNKF